MGLPVQVQLRYWGIAAAVLFAILWWLGDVLMPFILGAAIAYLLDPAADRLERMGCGRALATVIVFGIVALVVTLDLLIAVPLLLAQSQQLISAAPGLLASARDLLVTQFPSLFEQQVMDGMTGRITSALQEGGGQLLNTLVSSSLALINVVILFVVAPVVGFYLLLDWDRLIGVIDDHLPREHAPVIRDLAGKIDNVLSGFVRGQLSVCVILGSFYAVGLVAAGLNFGLLIGITGGLLSFIPFVGATLGGLLAIGVALSQAWGDWVWIALIAGVFVVGQLIEGYFLTPVLVGGSTGLHPVVLMLALSVFGTIFGFAGVLVAVPLAAALGVLLRFGVEKYRDGRLYKGPEAE